MSISKNNQSIFIVTALLIGIIGGGIGLYFYFQTQINEYESESISLNEQIDNLENTNQNLINQVNELSSPKSRIEITEKKITYFIDGIRDFAGNLLECQFTIPTVEATLVNAGDLDGFIDISILLDGVEYKTTRYFIESGKSRWIHHEVTLWNCDSHTINMEKIDES